MISKTALQKEICLYAFEKVQSGICDELVMTSDICEVSQRRPLEIDKMKLLFGKIVENGECKIVVKDSIGFRSFNLELITGDEHELFYKLKSIREIEA